MLGWPREVSACPHQPLWVEADEFLFHYGFTSDFKFVGKDKRVFCEPLHFTRSGFFPHQVLVFGREVSAPLKYFAGWEIKPLDESILDRLEQGQSLFLSCILA